MIKHSMKAVAIATVIGGMIAGAVSASAALNLPTQSCAFTFNTNMKLGSRGADVKNLQVVLNGWPQTQVAASGAGSPGMETTTFGPATRTAVNKFQNLHKVELGITAATGNVFAGTRGLLNGACNGSVVTNPGTGTTVPGTGTVVSGPVSAMLGASQPTGMIVSGQSGALLANITFTGNGTVTSIQLQRIGVSADTVLNNVYLYDGNTRISDAASVVTGGYINFNASNGLFAVNGSRTITVRADILVGATSGQSVGVKLNSVTAGGSASTYSNVMGNTLTIASVDTSKVNFASYNNSAILRPDAGTTNYTVWEMNPTVSTRSVNFKAATFKFVGSAPTDAIANLSLYIDGAKVAGPASINAMNNNKVTFDLGATPYLLTTGSHTLSLRGDVVKGSYRSATFSVENVSDLMFEDSNLAGVNVSATIGGSNGTFTQSGATYNTITVNKGSVTVSTDSSFTANKVTGGATNVPVGQFTLKAYGEDVKVSTLKVDFESRGNGTSATSTLNNVSLYVNGGQVGTSQNFTGTAASSTGLTYNLGSSLIIPANTTVTLTVKADIVDVTSAAYTTGSITTHVMGTAGNAQGQSSYESVDVALGGQASNALTVSSGAGSFARTSGFQGITVAPNTANVKIGSFTLQANSAEAIKVNSVGVGAIVANGDITNYSSLTLQNGSTVLGTPVGNPTAGTTTFSFQDILIPVNGSVTLDVYANVGGGSATTINTAMTVTTRGAVSNTTATAIAGGVTITSAASTLAATTLQSSSPVAQFVVGGSTFGIATYKVSTAVSGTQATITEIDFATTGLDAIESITVGGVTKAVAGSGDTATTTITGLNIVAGYTGVDVPVTVKFSGFQPAASNGLLGSVGTVKVTLSRVQATSGNGSAIYKYTQVASNAMNLVASKPTVTVASGAGSSQVILGSEAKIGEFTITADAAGKIGIATTTLTVSTQGIDNPEISLARVTDGNTNITGAVVTGSSTLAVNFITSTTPAAYEISAGQSKTFSIYATVKGTQTSNTLVPYVTSRLASDASLFKWVDVIGGNTAETGTAIYNFPTNSYTTTH